MIAKSKRVAVVDWVSGPVLVTRWLVHSLVVVATHRIFTMATALNRYFMIIRLVCTFLFTVLIMGHSFQALADQKRLVP